MHRPNTGKHGALDLLSRPPRPAAFRGVYVISPGKRFLDVGGMMRSESRSRRRRRRRMQLQWSFCVVKMAAGRGKSGASLF